MYKNILKKYIPYFAVNFVKRVLIYLPLEKAALYNGIVKKQYHNHEKRLDNICIFSHFDKDGIIDEYVIFYLQSLMQQDFDIVFVSTSESLEQKEIYKIKNLCRDILVKENIGYDFGAWQSGISYLNEEIYMYDSLLLCNDSVYAPIYPLNEMFNKMQNRFDFWGVTDSYEIYHHLQSYFMVFNKKVVASKIFQDIWKTYKVYKIKRNIIFQYEIGLSQKLLKHGYLMGVYCPYKDLNVNNIQNSSHYNWKELIEDFRYPVIKIELLRDNPKNIDIVEWKKVLKKYTDYDSELISRHLIRMD